VVLALQVLGPNFSMYFVTLYVLHAVPISVLFILFFIYLVSSHDAIFIVKFSLTFHYFRNIATKYVAQILKLHRFFFICVNGKQTLQFIV